MNLGEYDSMTTEGKAMPQKRSLMNSLEKLNSKVSMLESVSELSEKMVDKMKRTQDMLKPGNSGIEKNPTPKILDVIDLFDSVSDRMGALINKIGNNISQTIDMIE